MNLRLCVALAIATILATSWYACGGKGSSSNSSPTSPSGPTSSATMFEGTIAGASGQSGAFSVTIQTTVASSSVASLRAAGLTLRPESFTQVSGTLNVAGGASVTLAGSYDSSANTVSLSGGGFTFTGSINGAVLSGTYTGPSGSGGFSSLNASQNSVTAYCGTFTNPSPGDSGIWNLQVSANGAVSGVAIPTNPTGAGDFARDGTFLTGQLSGSNLTIRGSGPGCMGKTGDTSTGTVQNGIVNGTTAGNLCHGPGTFTGSTGTCSVPVPPPAASVVGFIISIDGNSSGSYAASLQNETLTAAGAYTFMLSPGVYTISGQALGGGGGNAQQGADVSISFHVVPGTQGNSGVAPGVQGSITGGLPSATQTVFPCMVFSGALNQPNPFMSFQVQFTVTTSAPVCQ
jgi:hypothetical protein